MHDAGEPIAASLHATPPAEEDESRLIARLRAGDAVAFEELVRTEGPRLLAVARRILGTDADAHDAFQDAMVSAYNALDRFEGQSKLGTWLHRIVVNAALRILRTRRRKRLVAIEDLLPRYDDSGHRIEPVTPWTESAEHLLEQADMRDLVRAKIHELPDDYRDVLLLRDIEELDTRATAEVLSISEGAVKTRLHRARQALRALLEPELGGDGS